MQEERRMQVKFRFKSKCCPRIYWIQLFLVLVTSGFQAHASTPAESVVSGATQHATPRHRNQSGLEGRISAITRALDLDNQQQARLRKALMEQREQIRKIWNDESLPAPYRISATEAVTERTADQIRSFLNDEQRKKYNQPKQSHEATGSIQPNVEDWMNPARSSQGR
jgi:hypothetical protein